MPADRVSYSPGVKPPSKWTPKISGFFHWHKWERIHFTGMEGQPISHKIDLMGKGRATVETPWECSKCLKCAVLKEYRKEEK